MTPERAKEILEAFGPCSNVYECMTVEEIVRDAADLSEREWVEIMLQVEDIDRDRMLGTIDDPARHAAAVRESAEWIRGLRARLAPFLKASP
jgi:hypothetical protein